MKTSFGRLLAGGGAGALVFNAFFPRAADPWDPAGVLTMMAENPLRRQVAFIGVTVSVLLIAGCVIELAARSGRTSGHWGAGLVALGASCFTAATALGLAGTGPARSWAAGDGGTDGDYLIATTLNRADDFLWFVSIVVLWAGFGMAGVALRGHAAMPRRAGSVLAVVGFVTALGVGLPLATGIEWLGFIVAFGVLAMITAVWALVVGIGLARRSATA